MAWIGILRFERPVLTFFGTDEALLALAREYLHPIKYVFPLFLFNQMLAAFLRKAPAGADDDGIIRGILDGAQHGVSERLHPDFHVANAGNTGHGARHYPHLRAVVSAAAVQHFPDILFSGDYEARRCVHALPALAGADALWLAMPVTELLVMLYAAAAIRRFIRALPRQIS